MPWVETPSLSFVARHESTQARAAERVLDDLERFRAQLEGFFEHVPGEVAVVIHPRPLMLSLAHPWLPVLRVVSAPAGRRYFAGFFNRREIHVLAPAALEERASGVPGSREALALSPRHEYAHLVIGSVNPALPPPFTPGTFRRYLQMAWLAEGAATHFAGQVPHLRAAVARRLHEGGQPSFPPGARDGLVLGGTVFGLLEAEAGEDACVELARSASATAAKRVLEEAFKRPMASIERSWTDYLAALAARQA
ncbi:MAG: hypothetical protein ACR2J6_07840 [Thermoleophilaceae bacterium]